MKKETKILMRQLEVHEKKETFIAMDARTVN